MTFFSSFPLTTYSFDGRNAILITDFMRRIAIPKSIKENLALYELYDIGDGETPEMVANKVYHSCDLHWIILTINEIVDPRFDWCLSQENLVAVCQSKYTNIYDIHHYKDETGLVVDSNYPGAYPVSNFEYEDKRNEDRRHIRLLSPVFVNEFIQQFEKEIAK